MTSRPKRDPVQGGMGLERGRHGSPGAWLDALSWARVVRLRLSWRRRAEAQGGVACVQIDIVAAARNDAPHHLQCLGSPTGDA